MNNKITKEEAIIFLKIASNIRAYGITTIEQLQDQSKMTLHNDIYPNSHEFSQPLVPYFKQLHEIIHETKSNSVNVKC